MGYFMVHLKVAQRILECNREIKDKSAFYKGSLAPDAIMFRQGCIRSDKELTHFCVGDESWGYYTNYEDWYNSLFLKIENYKDKINEDFLFGYFAHVYTDILYTKQIWTPNRLKNDENHLEKYFQDCYEIDSHLLESLDNKADIWSLLNNSENYSLSDLLSSGDMDMLIGKMAAMYCNRKSNKYYKFNAISITDMHEFIEMAIGKVNESYMNFFKKI